VFVPQVLSPVNNSLFALKVVALEDLEESVLEQYMNEVRLLHSLTQKARQAAAAEKDKASQSPSNHVIELIDFETTADKKTLLIVLEFAEQDLHRVVRSYGGTLLSDIPMLRYCWTGMLRAVAQVHAQKIVHGDLKPANFVMVRGQVKIIDFGIAKVRCGQTLIDLT